jgi:hypothetical protein
VTPLGSFMVNEQFPDRHGFWGVTASMLT